MANADKCFLLIPKKQYLRALADSVDDDGRIDKAALFRAADEEFENYKAIERRINDPDCTGAGCCQAVFTGRRAGSDIPSGDGDEITLIQDSGDIAPTGFSTTLAAGMWVVNGQATFAPTGTATSGECSVNRSPTITPDTSGGSVYGAGHHAGADFMYVNFGGVLMEPSTWTPTFGMSNNTDVTQRPASVRVWMFRICDPCDFTIAPGGG